MELSNYYPKYLTKKRCVIDLLHFFIGWAILSINKPEILWYLFGNPEVYRTSINSTAGCENHQPMLSANIMLLITVSFSMILSFICLMQHIFSQTVAKFEPKLFVLMTMLFIGLSIIVTVIPFVLLCISINVFINFALLVLQAVLYYSQYCITKDKLLLQNRRRPTAPLAPPDYDTVTRPQSFRLPYLANENVDDNEISCSMDDFSSANNCNR